MLRYAVRLPVQPETSCAYSKRPYSKCMGPYSKCMGPYSKCMGPYSKTKVLGLALKTLFPEERLSSAKQILRFYILSAGPSLYFISDISGLSQQEWILTFIFTSQNAEGDWATSKPGCKCMQQGAYGIPIGFFFHQRWGFELSSGQISPNESMRPNTGTVWLLQIVRFQGSKLGNLTSNSKNVFYFCFSKYLNLLTSKPQLQIS